MLWDRLSDESKRIFQIAGQEAGKLGHNLIGTEHILLAFLLEDERVTGNFFAQGLGLSYGSLYPWNTRSTDQNYVRSVSAFIS